MVPCEPWKSICRERRCLNALSLSRFQLHFVISTYSLSVSIHCHFVRGRRRIISSHC